MKNALVFLLVAMVAMSGCTRVDKTAEANKALAQSSVDEIWNKGNLDVIDDYCAANFVRHNPDSWPPAMVEGPDGFKEYVGAVRTDYPDFQVEVHNWVAEGDMVAVNWTVTGTHKDSEKKLSVQGISLSKYADGKVVEEWVSWDTYGGMQQLGMIPEPETSMK